MRAIGFSAFVVLATVASLSAQSLADVAKKEEERRKQVTTPAKVYTNKDLAAVPPPSNPPAAVPDSMAGSGAPSTAEKPPEAAADAPDKPAGPVKDQRYWRERMQSALQAVDRDQVLADAMQSRINGLTTDFVNRDDPAQRAVIQRDRDRALAELDRLKKAVTDDRKAISDLEEEARRAGVPPGWLR